METELRAQAREVLAQHVPGCGGLGAWCLSAIEAAMITFAASARADEREKAARLADERASAYGAIPVSHLLNAARQGEAERIATAIRNQEQPR